MSQEKPGRHFWVVVVFFSEFICILNFLIQDAYIQYVIKKKNPRSLNRHSEKYTYMS